MSSTNRTNASERHISDYYITPTKDIVDFFTHWVRDIQNSDMDDFLSVSHNLNNLVWLDPCAGGDATHDMSYPSVIINELGTSPENISTLDIRPDSRADVICDFLHFPKMMEYDIVITNPPFNIALEIIQKSFEVVQTGGYVIMLLRLNFLGSKSRKPFFDKYPPMYVYVHHKRMSFTENGATDSIEYAHFVWKKGYTPEHTLLKVI